MTWPESIRRVGRALPVILGAGVAGCGRIPQPSMPSPERVAALEAAFARAPGSVDNRLHLAAAYNAAGRSGESAELLAPLAAQPSPEPAVLFLMGTSLEKEGRYAEARQAYQAYLGIDGPLPLRRSAEARVALMERRELEQAVRNSIARESELAAAPREDAVGVFPFLFGGSDPDLRPLSRGFAELLSTDLAQTDRLTVVERSRLQFLLDELQLGESGAADPATAARAGRMVGAGRIVQGRIDGDESDLRVQAVVVRIGGNPGTPITESGAIDRVFDMEKQIALAAYSQAGIQLTVAERERVLQRHTANVQALLAFGFGLEADDSNRFDEAVGWFERSLGLDGDFALARIWLERSRRKAEASEEDIDPLVGLGETELGWLLPEWLRRRLLFAGVDPMVPDPDLRNPAPEVLGVEGLNRRATVDVIIRPPGGGQ